MFFCGRFSDQRRRQMITETALTAFLLRQILISGQLVDNSNKTALTAFLDDPAGLPDEFMVWWVLLIGQITKTR